MKHNSCHPNDDVLREFALGRLDDSESIERHVTDCQECARRVDLIARRAGDTFVNELRRNVAEDENHRSVIDVLSDTIGDMKKVSLPDADGHETPVVTVGSRGVTTPAQLGKFRIVGEIARGGVGAVLRARDEDIGRDVAIKVLLDDHANNVQITERFVEEAQIGGQLQHPGIVPIHEMGLLGKKKPYIAMKLVKGQTLARLLDLRHDLVSQRQHFLGIFQQICQPMAYAHSKGVVHRDLKPSNVMVGAFGEVQVMDWGLSKILARGGVNDDQRATRPIAHSQIETIRSGSGSESLSGSVIGTPAYMAPEQAQGRIEDTDERSDVFGLGAILCEMLTGDPPYRGETAQEIYQQAKNGYLDDASGRLDECGADSIVTDLAKRCLAFDARRRPRDAGAVLAEISAYLDSLESQARRAQIDAAKAAAKAEAEIVSRRRTLVLSAALLLAIVLGGNGYWSWRTARRESVSRTQSEFKQALARAAALVKAESMDEATAALDTADDQVSENVLSDDIRRLRHWQRIHSFQQDLREIRLASDLGAIDARYDAAYRELLGDDLFAAAAQDVEESIRQTGIAPMIAIALDEWALVRRRKGREWEPLIEMAKSIDPNKSWRIRLWDELENKDSEIPIDFLVRNDEVPASLLCLVASGLPIEQSAQQEALLRKVLRQHPGDFRANYMMGNLLSDLRGRQEEGLRYLISANALRPDHLRAATVLLYQSSEAHAFRRIADVFTHALKEHSGPRESILDWGVSLFDGLRPSTVNVSPEALDAWIAELKAHFDMEHPSPQLSAALGQAIGHRYGADEANEALAWPQMVVDKTRRENPYALSMLARVQHHVEQSDEAVRSMEEAVALGGGSVRELSRYRLAVPHPVSYDSLDAELQAHTIVPLGDSWRYFKGKRAPDTNWTLNDFDDQSWQLGRSGFGYGSGDAIQQTVLDDMKDGYTTLYLRKHFSSPLTDSLLKATLSLCIDGGFVVYLNGRQLMARSLDPKADHSAVSDTWHTPWTEIDLTPALQDGENCVAIFAARPAYRQGHFSLEPVLSVQHRADSQEFLTHIQTLKQLGLPEQFLRYIDGRQAQLLGRYEEAEKHFRRIIQLDSTYIAPFRRLFECLEQLRGTRYAVEELNSQIAAHEPRGYLAVAHEDVNLQTRFDGEAFHFEASPLISADPRVRHMKTRWEICEVGKEFHHEKAFDWLTESQLKTLKIPVNRLEPNKTYRCRATYVLAQGTHEVRSEPTLITGQYKQELVHFNLNSHFNADVLMNLGDTTQDNVDGDEDAFAAMVSDDPLYEKKELGIHQLGDHDNYNVIQLTENDSAAVRLSLENATQLDTLRILMTSGWGEAELPVRMEYADGTFEDVIVQCEDWDDKPTDDDATNAQYFFSQDFVPVLTGLDVIRSSGRQHRDMSIFEANIQLASQKTLTAVVFEPAEMIGHSPRLEFPSRVNIFAITGVRCPAGD